MTSFKQSTVKVLLSGAALLAAGVYYQGVTAKQVELADQAVRQADTARSQLQVARGSAENYNVLLANMADRNVDRQEPFSVVSEFSPQEVANIGTLLDTLYKRDGYFFLEHFQLAWRKQPGQVHLPPKVVLDLDGRKMLLFSDEAHRASSLVSVIE